MAPAADAAADTTATTTCTEDDEDASDAGASSSSPVGGGGGGSGGGGMSGSQRELVDIMQQVKTKHLTVDEAEACFYDWKARHEHGFSRSFRQKQVGPAALRRSFGDVRKASSPPHLELCPERWSSKNGTHNIHKNHNIQITIFGTL